MGVPTYKKFGADHPNAVSPQTAWTNLTVGTVGLFAHPSIVIMYGGYELFYSGGMKAATEAVRQADEILMERRGFNYFQHKM